MNAASQALVAEKFQAPRGDEVDAAGYELEDGALGVGGGVELFKHLTVKAGYEWGLMNLSKADGMTINRNQFVVSAGLSF